jgi:RNA polymerase sigma-70 factor (ECF subfamily)
MKDLIATRIKLGDEQAFELLFRKYYVRLCGFANKFLNDHEEAQNIVQDVFTKIWEGREDIELDDSLKSYIFKATQNLCLNKITRNKVESKYLEIYRQVYINNRTLSASESLFAKELESNIAVAIDKLPGKCKKIFELSRIEGLKYSEIAEILHISIKTVEAQMSKALRTLRIELKDYLTILIILIFFRNP